MKLTGLLNTLWFRRSTVAVLAYAMALASVSATKESHATSEPKQASSDNATSAAAAVPLLTKQVELIHTIVPVNVPTKVEAKPAISLPKVRTIMMQVTAYCPCKKCCGSKAQGITASGKNVSYNNGRFVAADRSMAFGTKLIIPGYGEQAVEVIDRGGAIKGNKLDVFFPTHAEALKWGRQNILVTIVE